MYFDEKKWVTGPKKRGDVRRLGTASWGVNKDKALSTQWLWYFKNDRNEWQVYDNPHAIEEAFVDGSHEFDLDRDGSEFKYKLYFLRKFLTRFSFFSSLVILAQLKLWNKISVGEQENATTHTFRPILRRPK